MESRFLEGLNMKQQEAVRFTDGPLLVLAGAGSGKTRVLTHRIGYLIETGVRPENILAITFTNKAAREMKERIGRLLGDETAGRVFISTFHSMCVRLLRRDIEKLGYTRDFSIYDADDQKTLLRNIVKKLSLDQKVYRERGLASLISANKNNCISASDFEKNATGFYEENAAKIYIEYERELKTNNALDFDDLLIKTVKLLRDFSEVLAYWQDRFRYISVDEYQDTNNVQFEIVRLLAEKSRNLFVVGDDDQSIYKFRGANIENILSFEKSFPGAHVVKLEQNYRSTGSILCAANEVISHNRSRKQKTLWTGNEGGMKPRYNEYDNASAEADATIRDILSVRKKGFSGTQAILYRTNAQSRLFEERCVFEGLPYVIVGGVNFYQRKEIKDMLSYLKILVNESDDLSLHRIINTPKRGIGDVTVEKLMQIAGKRGISCRSALSDDSVLGMFSASARNNLAAFGRLLDGFENDLDHDIGLKALMEKILEKSGLREEIGKDDPVSAETRLENIDELINKAVDFENNNAERGRVLLSAFLEEVSLIADIDRTALSGDALTLMTLHASKGLEFDEVYISGLEEGVFPSAVSIGALDPEAEIEEERRLCYVGITRARKRLFLSSARERMVRGELCGMKHSRFIDEIPEGAIEKHLIKKKRGSDQNAGFRKEGGKPLFGKDYFERKVFSSASGRRFGSLDRGSVSSKPGGFRNDDTKKGFEKQKPDYGQGDRVRHGKFGTGTVVSVEEEKADYKVTCDFDDFGRKIMLAGFAKLEKL